MSLNFLIFIFIFLVIIVEPCIAESIGEYNNVPVLSALSPDKESPQATGTTVAWSAVSSDSENDPIEFQFLLDGAVVQDWSSSPVWSWNADQAGAHIVEAKARDGQHDQNGDSSKSADFEIVLPSTNDPLLGISPTISQEKDLSVGNGQVSKTQDAIENSKNTLENSPPIFRSISPADFKIEGGSNVKFTWMVSDSENDPLTYAYSTNMDYKIIESISRSPWTYTVPNYIPGNYQIKILGERWNAWWL
jgi:hypothetical protein